MASKKIQLYTDRANTIEASPETSANCVILSDGNDLQKVLDNDLTNPTVVHEETSFKVGAGDIDVSSSVVDGEVGRMVIKGKTYQNILPEPSTHVLTNNKEMFKVNEGLDPNVEIVDGVSKSAILSGNTLVNISRFTKMSVNSSSVSVDDDGWVTVLNPTGNYNNAFYGVTGLEKPNTQYTLILEIKENTRTGASSFIQRNDYYPSVFNITQNISIEGGFVGTKKFLLTTKEDLSDCLVTSRTFVDSSGGTLIFRQVLIEGDYTDVDIPYFEGMTSCKMPVLTTTGKNLFDENRRYESSNKLWFAIPFEKDSYFTFSSFDTIPYIEFYGTTTEFIDKLYGGDGTSWKALATFSNKESGTFKKESKYNYIIIAFDKAKLSNGEDFLKNLQVEQGTQATPYEPYKSNILHTPEEVVLKGIGDVKDTLNCNTGEMVERISEIVYTGNEDWKSATMAQTPDNIGFYLPLSNHLNDTNNTTMRGLVKDNLGFTNNCFSATINRPELNGKKGFSIHNNGNVYFTIPTSECANVNDWKNKLKEQPLVLQYAINPVVKTVDLSSSGNCDKIAFNGSEDWILNSSFSNESLIEFSIYHKNNGLITCDRFPIVASSSGERIARSGNTMYVRVLKEKLDTQDVNGFKRHLSQNPIMVWYQTETHQDSTQVKQPIFFKDGHIMQSSGADHSLIPTLDYQAKTSNSYVMDLMKTNTRYTMKAKSASGTFTIDGTSYGAGINGTITTPSSMTNKFLVMSNKTNEEVMILEGDVVSKSIPYFKGIKSAFEDESKIEVLSTNCVNLFNPKDIVNDTYWDLNVVGKTSLFISSPRRNAVNMQQIDSNGAVLTSRVNELEDLLILHPNAVKLRLQGGCFRPTDAWHELIVSNLVVADAKSENNVKEIDYATNSTKIPLLSPLRSLPNGVCDELIIDRMKKKATLIQRTESIIFNGSENWNLNGFSHDKLIEFVRHSGTQINHTIFSDRFVTGGENVERVAFGGGSIYIRISKTKVGDVNSFKQWLSQNPLTVQYGLKTPIITEIDLENFPLVYKDGHIFLNSEIAPVVEIDYNVNQAQQIQANNETLQRHELDILDLDNLIVSFVNAEYNLRLLKFDMELSMMALAE